MSAQRNSTSTFTWRQAVKDADPDWEKERTRARKIYQFSSGRTFDDKQNPYSTP